MSRPGQAVLAFWHDVVPAHEADFHAWHMREHLPERLAVPDFLRGRRYQAIDQGTPQRFYNDYLVASPEVLASPAYLARLNEPTAWTQRVVPHFRNTNRSACRVIAAAGRGEGGVLATLRLELADPAREAAIAAFLDDITSLPDICAAELWKADAEISLVETSEKRIRAGDTTVADRVVVIEGMFAPSLRHAACHMTALLEDRNLIARPPDLALYGLVFRLEPDMG